MTQKLLTILDILLFVKRQKGRIMVIRRVRCFFQG